MAIYAKSLLLILMTSFVWSNAATNEYYTKPEAKKIADKIIKAYGGEEKLKQFERFKVHGEIKSPQGVAQIILYESRTKARVDMVAGRSMR